MCEAGHRWPEFNLKGELAWHQAVVLISKFMTYPLLFYLPVARLWAHNEPDCSSRDKRINSSKGVGLRRRLSALGLRRDPHGSVKQIHHEELEDGDKSQTDRFRHPAIAWRRPAHPGSATQ